MEQQNVPPLVRLASLVSDESRRGLKPLGALYAVVPSQIWQFLRQLTVLVLLQMLGRREVGLDLVDVPDLIRLAGQLMDTR